MEDSICNIPVKEVDVKCKILRRPADSNYFLIVTLRRKLEYKGYVAFELVKLALVMQFIEFLRSQNHSYSDININLDNIPIDVLDS